MACNGSQLVGLNVAPQGYQGQFNLNYTRSDGVNGLCLSEFFYVNNITSSTPVIWSLQNPAPASVPASDGLPGTITAAMVHATPTITSLSSVDSSSRLFPSSSPYSVLSPSPPTSLPLSSAGGSSSLNPRQVAGISTGAVLVTILALALLGILLLKRKRQRATTKGRSHAQLTEPDMKRTPIIGNTTNSNENELLGPQLRELDGHERRAQLQGDGERWELGGETAEDMQERNSLHRSIICPTVKLPTVLPLRLVSGQITPP